MSNIYLDNHGSTPVDPRWISCYAECLKQHFANPSSTHFLGKKARALMIEAKEHVLSLLNHPRAQALFTSCATEALNQLLFSIAETYPGAHVVSSPLEHDCVYQTLLFLQEKGKLEVSFCEVEEGGAPIVSSIEKLINTKTKLLCFMGANNETGAKSDLAAIDSLAQRHSLYLVIDAVAQAGREPLYVPKSVFAQVISAHKFCAPRGAAALLHHPQFPLKPLLLGGGQQYGLRSGTENTPAIYCLGLACKDLVDHGPAYYSYQQNLQQHFELLLSQQFSGAIVVNGKNRVPSCSNISFIDFEGEILLAELDRQGIAVSHGSACSSGALEPSRVLMRMGLPKKRYLSAIRFSFSRLNSVEEIEQAVTRISSLNL